MEPLKCIGCGITIQTEEPKKEGYAPPSSLTNEQLVCQRCFRLRNYNEIQPVSLTGDDFLTILHSIGERKGLVVKIVDIFDFNGSWISGLHRFVGQKDILLIGNKSDLLPRSINPNRLINWMKKEANKLGLKPVDVLLVSAFKGHGMDRALQQIDHLRKGEDVFVVGCTNTGKSTFINYIIKGATGEDEVITTSHFPGTTLDIVEIPLSDGKAIIDTPGIINDHQIAHYLDDKELKFITPKSELKPKSFQLNQEQTLFIGGMARFDYLAGERSSFLVYLSNRLMIHRTKLSNADALYEKHKGKMLTPPSEQTLKEMPALVRHEFSIKEKKVDLVISGLGWITIQNPGVVAIHVPQGVDVLLRPSLI